MNSDSPSNILSKHPRMNEYNKEFGNIFTYNLDQIYINVFKLKKWSPLKTIELFEELSDEYVDELSYVDDEFDRLHIKTKIKMIKCYIDLLEGSMV